jgi:hypothetical protein
MRSCEAMGQSGDASHNLAGAGVDPAAVLGAAVSLWQACQRDPRPDLSACYGDGIQWMREVMRVATLFETWATRRVCFDEFDECWPYFLEDRFGDACVALIGADGLARFEEADCLHVALRLRLSVICSDGLVVPRMLDAENPVVGSAFRRYRIQAMHSTLANDDPFDEECGPPFFALYGIGANGLLEHIADRRNYAEVRELALKLAPGIAFPEVAVMKYLGARNMGAINHP